MENFYVNGCINSNWSVLKHIRQISLMYRQIIKLYISLINNNIYVFVLKYWVKTGEIVTFCTILVDFWGFV